MTITEERRVCEVLLEILATQEDHDYDVMLEVRNRSVRSRDLPATLVAEEWLGRHGMDSDERQTCPTCSIWIEGHDHAGTLAAPLAPPTGV
jgi:hypothetical protein